MRAVKQQKGLEFFQLHTHLAGCATEALVLLLVHFPIALFFCILAHLHQLEKEDHGFW